MSVGNIPSTTIPGLGTDSTGAKGELSNAETELGITLGEKPGDDSFVSTTGETGGTNAPAATSEADINALIEKLKGQIESLKQKIEQYDKQIERLENELKELKAQLANAEKALSGPKAELERLNNELAAKQEKFAQINDAIESATKSLEADAKAQQQKAIYEAMSEYDEEKDGDWTSFLDKKLSGIMENSSLSNLIAALSTQSKSVMKELGTLNKKISMQTQQLSTAQGVVDGISTKITQASTALNEAKALKAQAETNVGELDKQMSAEIAKLVLSKISPEEKQLAIDNKLDLTEKYPNGNPKYVLAPGKRDGVYHIYEMNEQGTYGTSLARKYAPGQGYDIVQSGNGFMSGVRNVPAGEGEKVYNLTCCNEDLTECKSEETSKCYSTSSPLSFDINGDGVKTSDKMIKYDIDGDGKLDNINDSADGILCFDSDGNGISGESGSECFGDNTDIDGDGKADGFKNGFEALKALAFKEKLVNGTDDNVLDENDIKVLEDKYGLKIKLDGYNGEAVSLFSAGITEINLGTTNETTTKDNFDGQDNLLMSQEGATFKVNGEMREYADIWHAKK